MRTWKISESFADFISFDATLKAAQQAGLSVGDYIDQAYNTPGATQATIDKMAELCSLGPRIQRVCEIGPGSGRYLEKVLKLCQPSSYEIYETATDWREWLAREYPVEAHLPDGVSLSGTATASMDLVHAHKVFPGIPVLSIFRYLKEMARVAKPSASIVFDVLTENCFDPPTLEGWLGSNVQYPRSMMCKGVLIDFLSRERCIFVGSFIVPMAPGKTEALVFKKA